jgi:sarcosine oxidase
MGDRPTAVVVGAGVFGAATARELGRRAWDVTLVDQHPPGHVRATSGGESRLIRFAHGTDSWYTASAWRARQLWTELEEDTGADLLARCGVAWFAHGRNGWEADSAEVLEAQDIPARRLTAEAASGLFPSLSLDDLDWVLYEPGGGGLEAPHPG